MKTTKERLAESWCRPKTGAEWRSIFKSDLNDDDKRTGIVHWQVYLIPHRMEGVDIGGEWVAQTKTEIPVPHFIDLFHDRIAPWRLEEDGFEQIRKPTCVTHHLTLSDGAIVQVTSGRDVSVIEKNEFKGDDHILFQGVRTYTNLITLIRMKESPAKPEGLNHLGNTQRD